MRCHSGVAEHDDCDMAASEMIAAQMRLWIARELCWI
jgi:hypothetical protein